MRPAVQTIEHRATALLIKAAQVLARGGHDEASVAFLIADLEAWIRRSDK